MARRKKDDTADLLWQGLVGFPALIGFAVVFHMSHSTRIAGIAAGALAGIGIGILVLRRISLDQKLKRSGIDDIDRMEGRRFEFYLAHLFKAHGYSVQVTRESGDYGADLVLRKDGQVIVVQAKRYSQNVGIKAVQEAHAAIAHYKADLAWVVSNRDYTEAATSLAKSNGVRLIGRNELVDMITKTNPGGSPQSTPSSRSVPSTGMTCERCGQPMVLRSGTKGQFWGCSGFPTCRNAKQFTT